MSGKSSWVKPRHDVVTAKGKGELQTFWLLPKSATRSSVTNSTDSHVSSTAVSVDDNTNQESSKAFGTGMPISRQEQSEAKLDRLIFWVSESLLQSLRHIVARRNATSSKKPSRRGPARESVRELEQELSKQKVVLEEVREIITLPKFDAEAYQNQVDPKTIKLDPNVETQLREYVTVIASLYQSNPFQ